MDSARTGSRIDLDFPVDAAMSLLVLPIQSVITLHYREQRNSKGYFNKNCKVSRLFWNIGVEYACGYDSPTILVSVF